MRILMVVESFSPKVSGGCLVLRIANTLKKTGALVKIFSVSDNSLTQCNIFDECKIEVSPQNSGFLHIFPGHDFNIFKKIIDDFNPTLIHFCSLDYIKSRFLFKYAYKKNLKTVAQPWLYNFFCAQGYCIKREKTCDICSNGSFYNALRFCCGKLTSRFLQCISRYLLRKDVLLCQKFLSPCKHMDKVLLSYGITPNKIIKINMPFDPKRISNIKTSDNKKFIFYGQTIECKGINLLERIFNICKTIQFEMFVPVPKQLTNKLRLKIKELENVQLYEGVIWSTLSEHIANSRGVLMPSIWPTTIEYGLLEALGLSKPVVAFNVGIHNEILKHRENAMVVPVNDVNSFCQSIYELEQDCNLRQLISRNARKTFEEFTSEDRLLNSLSKAYFD